MEVWKTINLGTGLRTADDFRRALKDGGFCLSSWGDDILGNLAFTRREEAKVDLVVVSVAELGFKDGAYCRDIYKRAKGFGLGLCSSEVGPQVRLQYKDQPNGEWLLVGMEPILESGGYLSVFEVGRDARGLWLHSHCGLPDDFWNDRHRCLFVLPASSA